MKIRKSFVSNSSSSSFTCDVCGANESGMDLCLSDINMSECVNGHTFCNNHINKDIKDLSVEQKREILIKQNKYDEDEDEVERIKALSDKEINEEELQLDDYNYPAELCPCCTFEELSDKDMINYVEKIHNISRKEYAEQLRNKFKSYDEFTKFIKGE